MKENIKKTDKEVFLELLNSANILYSRYKNYVNVENSPYSTGHEDHYSCWDFNDDGKLIAVGHYGKVVIGKE